MGLLIFILNTDNCSKRFRSCRRHQLLTCTRTFNHNWNVSVFLELLELYSTWKALPKYLSWTGNKTTTLEAKIHFYTALDLKSFNWFADNTILDITTSKKVFAFASGNSLTANRSGAVWTVESYNLQSCLRTFQSEANTNQTNALFQNKLVLVFSRTTIYVNEQKARLDLTREFQESRV